MDKILITISLILFIAIVFLILFLYKSTKRYKFISTDGELFDSQSDLDAYQKLLEKTLPLFSYDESKDNNKLVLGFNKSFLNTLRNEGFSDLKTIVKYRKDIQAFSDLINT